MAFKPKGEKANFTRLSSILNQTKTQTENNPLYQVIKGLIDNARQEQEFNASQISTINQTIDSLVPSSASTGNTEATYVTGSDETSSLPNSLQLVAGTNIIFNTSTPNQLEISASSTPIPTNYWTPLTDGDVDETDLIFANGDAIMVFAPL